MFNELYQKVVEHNLLTYFKENNFNSLDLDRILAEVNRSKKLYGDFNLERIIEDVRLSKLHEQTPAPAAPAQAQKDTTQQPPAQQAPPAGQKPAAPAAPAAPDPKAAAAATKLVQDIDVKWKDFTDLLKQAKTQVLSLFGGK